MAEFEDDAMSEMADEALNQFNDDEVYDEDANFWNTLRDEQSSLLDSEDLFDMEDIDDGN